MEEEATSTPPTATSSSNETIKKRKITNNKTIRVTQFTQNTETFINSGWKFVNAVQKQSNLGPALLKRLPTHINILELFFNYFTSDVLDLLQKIVNKRIAAGANYRRRKYYHKDVSSKELMQFYAIQILMENSYGNDVKNRRKHFKKIKETHPSIMGVGRFEALRRAFVPSIDEISELSSLFTSIFTSNIDDVSVVAIDEALIGYQSSKKVKQQAAELGCPIPVQHIPRKPHPNGLLLYFAATWIKSPFNENSKLPYIVDFHPHLQQADSAPQEVFKNFLERWPLEQKPHFVADSAFGSFELMHQHIQPLGFTATLSMPSTTTPYLWDVLSCNLPTGHWKAALNGNNVLASVHTHKDDTTGACSYKQIITNGFQAKLLPITVPSGSSTASQSTQLPSSVPLQASAIAPTPLQTPQDVSSVPKPIQATTVPPMSSTSTISTPAVQQSVILSAPVFPGLSKLPQAVRVQSTQAPRSNSTPQTPSVPQPVPKETLPDIDNLPPVIHRYSEASLLPLFNPVLEKICKTYNIKKQGKSKADLIKSIMSRVNYTYSKKAEFDQIVKSAKEQFFPDPSLCHEVYKQFFNIIDLADGYWYCVADNHAIYQWTSKMLFIILKYALINNWVHFTAHQVEPWIHFRQKLAEELIAWSTK